MAQCWWRPCQWAGCAGFFIRPACTDGLSCFLLISGLALKKFAAVVLIVLWLLTAIILTFSGPFDRTGNGFFATWAATFFATSFGYQIFFGTEPTLVRSVMRTLSFQKMDDAAGVSVSPVPIGSSSNIA